MTRPGTEGLLAGSAATGAGRGVRTPYGGLQRSWAGVRPQVIMRNYKTHKVDSRPFITTGLLSLRHYRLAIKISRELWLLNAQILP